MKNYKVGERKGKYNQYYSAGMKEYREKNWKKAIENLEKSLQYEERHYRTCFTLGKCYLKVRKDQEAEKMFKECIELDKSNTYARLELGKLYSKQGKDQEAERLFKEYIKLDLKGLHPRLELGKMYVKQGKDQEAEKMFKECIELDESDTYARLELGRLYALQGKNEKSSKMYEYILKNIDERVYDEKNRAKHFMKHMIDDKNKKIHGVLKINPIDILNKIDLSKIKKQVGYMSDIYCIKMQECGYQGGSQGDGHTLDYITIITMPNDISKILTIFPSDKIEIEDRTKEEER